MTRKELFKKFRDKWPNRSLVDINAAINDAVAIGLVVLDPEPMNYGEAKAALAICIHHFDGREYLNVKTSEFSVSFALKGDHTAAIDDLKSIVASMINQGREDVLKDVLNLLKPDTGKLDVTA